MCKNLTRVYAHLRVVFLWSSHAWDSSVHPVRHQSNQTLKGGMKHQMSLVNGVPLSILLSTPQGSRHGKMRKAATFDISQLSPDMTHCLARILFQVVTVFIPQEHFPVFWELRSPASVCIAVRQAGLRNDEFTPLCSYLYVCGLCYCLVCSKQRSQRLKSFTFNTMFWYFKTFSDSTVTYVSYVNQLTKLG